MSVNVAWTVLDNESYDWIEKREPLEEGGEGGDVLVIEIDLGQRHGLTGMGKGEIVASSRGWIEVTPTIALNLNCVESLRKKRRNGGA